MWYANRKIEPLIGKTVQLTVNRKVEPAVIKGTVTNEAIGEGRHEVFVDGTWVIVVRNGIWIREPGIVN